MLFEFVVSISFRASTSIFKWLDQNVMVYIVTTAKSFEYVIVFFIDYCIYHIKTSKEVTQVLYCRSSGCERTEGYTRRPETSI